MKYIQPLQGIDQICVFPPGDGLFCQAGGIPISATSCDLKGRRASIFARVPTQVLPRIEISEPCPSDTMVNKSAQAVVQSSLRKRMLRPCCRPYSSIRELKDGSSRLQVYEISMSSMDDLVCSDQQD